MVPSVNVQHHTTGEASAVPVVDLAQATSGEIVEAFVASSCAFVTNHGVAPELRRRMIDVSVEFFDRPLEERQRVAWDGEGWMSGWVPNRNVTDPSTWDGSPMLVEWFMAHQLDTFANWPGTPTSMRDVWTEYYAAMAGIAAKLITKLAEELYFPSDQLAAWTDHHFAHLCLNHYPAQTQPPESGSVRLPAHTDEDLITILTADDAPGRLQVRGSGGSNDDWTTVEFPPDAFLVQAGDLLERWTNGGIRANVHRVMNPPPEMAPSAQRDTVVFFYFPDLDTVIAPTPSCVEMTGGAVRFEPTTPRQHMTRRQDAKYSFDPDRPGTPGSGERLTS